MINFISNLSQHSRALLAGLMSGYPPAMHLAGGNKAGMARRRAVESLLRDVARIRAEKHPGILRRALLARRLQKDLADAGYDIAFVRELMPAILAELTRSSKPD